MNSSIYLKIKKFIEENRLLEYGDKIVAGVSGGADSVFLFTVLAKLAGEYGLGLCAVHVNHGIRGEEALRDEQYTVSLVEGLGYKCKVFRKDIKAMAAHLKLTEEEATYLVNSLIKNKSESAIADILGVCTKTVHHIKKSCLIKIWSELEPLENENNV